MMDGKMTPRQAMVEAAERAPERHDLNDQIRDRVQNATAYRLAERDRLRARLFAKPKRPRDESGRFASRARAAAGETFDGGPQGPVPTRSDRQRVNNAISTLRELRGT